MKLRLLIATFLASGITGTVVYADEISTAYFLPKAKIAASISQLLKACPATGSDEPLVVDTTSAIVVRYDPDPARPIRLTFPASGIFVGRSLELKLRENGTLESANAEVHGAGGAALAAIFKASAALLNAALPLAMGAQGRPLRNQEQLCVPEIATAVLEAAELRKTIAVADAKANGKGVDGADTRVEIADMKVRLSTLEEKLTLSTQAAVIVPTAIAGVTAANATVTTGIAGVQSEWQTELAPMDYTPWFGTRATANKLDKMKLPGRTGYFLKVAVAPEQLAAINSLPTSSGSQDHLSYVRSVPASVVVCTKGNKDCDSTLATASAFLPQVSPIFQLPLTGGVFANRIVSITMAESGAPTLISYKSQAELAEIATAVSGAAEAIEARRGDQEAERKRMLEETQTTLDILKAKKSLGDYLNTQN